jgi:archaellum biogenesis protein FlaJ (TadC family)
MRKFWKGFRKASDLSEREEKKRLRRELLDRLRELLRTGRHEAESEYVEIVKQIYRDTFDREIEKEDLKERIRQFHDAVNERLSLDRESS